MRWQGLNSFTLPGTAGGGPGAYTIQAQMPDVVTIQENTRVRVDDVNVGNVTKIELQDWHALVTMRINGDVHLPANSTAKLGQTSLLGSMHIELAPPKDEPPLGQLEERVGHPVVAREHVSDHRADLGVGRRSCSTAADSVSCRKSPRRSPRHSPAVKTTCAAC